MTTKIVEIETKPGDQQTNKDSSVLDKFWSSFRLSPIKFEHRILTDMRWLILGAIGPFLIMTLSQIAYYVIRIDYWMEAFGGSVSGLSPRVLIDPFLTYISTGLLFAAFIYRYFWYPGIRKTFSSIFQNSVLYEPDGLLASENAYLKFLSTYRKYLHSSKRYILPLSFIMLFVIIAIVLRNSFMAGIEGNPLLGFVVLVYLCMPVVWAIIGGFGLWTVFATTKAIMDITPRFVIQIQPLHSDKTGGLKQLGDLCSQIGLMIIVIFIPLTFYIVDALKHKQVEIISSVVVILCIIIAFAFWIVIKPLWDIHRSMVAYQQDREGELNEKARILYENFKNLIKQDKFEDANNIKTKIKILTDEIDSVQKYPQWPISYLPVLKSFVASGALSTLVSYLALIFNFTVGDNIKGFLDLIKTIFPAP